MPSWRNSVCSFIVRRQHDRLTSQSGLKSAESRVLAQRGEFRLHSSDLSATPAIFPSRGPPASLRNNSRHNLVARVMRSSRMSLANGVIGFDRGERQAAHAGQVVEMLPRGLDR